MMRTVPNILFGPTSKMSGVFVFGRIVSPHTDRMRIIKIHSHGMLTYWDITDNLTDGQYTLFDTIVTIVSLDHHQSHGPE